jgi:hypothetical protein
MNELQAHAPAARNTQPAPIHAKLEFQFLKEEPKLSGRLTRLMRKHQAFLAFLGTLIVLGTFVLKDLWRDDLRDYGDAIEKAQRDYRHFTEFQYSNGVYPLMNVASNEQTGEIIQRTYFLVDQHDPFSKYMAGSSSKQGEISKQWEIYRYANYVDEVCRNISPLARRINDPAINKKLLALKEEKKSFLARYDQVETASPDSKNNQSRFSLLGNKDASRLVEDTSEIENAVITKANESRERNAYMYKIATWASAVFYLVGIILAFMDKLVGVGGAIGES